MELLESLDRALFLKINKEWANSTLDMVLPSITNLHHHWWFIATIALLVGYLMFKNPGRTVRVVVALALIAGISDLFSYRIIKSRVQRQRPNNIESLQSVVRVPYGPKSPSFPSNHAVTTAALALTLSWYVPGWGLVFGFIAGAVAYSRVYVGVHFPSDVVGGVIIGIFLAILFRLAFLQRVPGFEPKRKIEE